MTLPFDTEQFFAVFAGYNMAVWPAQIALNALAVTAVAMAIRPRPWTDRAAALAIGRRLRFHFQPNVRGVTGALLAAYALLIYPVLGYLAGRRYPATPTFGAPCPTTILTLGLLLWTRAPRAVLVIPIAWSALGASAAFQLGVPEDLGLVAAGLVTAILAFTPGYSRARPTIPQEVRT